MDIQQARKALADAFSAHDVSAVKSFIDPSYVIRGADGEVAMSYSEFMGELPTFFSGHPEYKQSVESLASRADNDGTLLTTRHREVLRTWRRFHLVTSCWDEKWRNIGGEWLLLEERPHPD